MEAPPQLEISRLFDAPRDLVFKVWSSAEHMAGWLGPKDFTCTSCKADFRVGGTLRACISGPEDQNYWFNGIYREIVPGTRLVFTFRWEEEDALDTLITVSFTDEGGKTRMTFTQTPFRSVEIRDSHAGGWSECFERLAAYIARVAA
jgi:uncharacterized protein YndB with AHSA1/START domain